MKNGGLLGIAALCMDIRRLDFGNLFEETRWEGNKELQKKELGECCGRVCHPEAMGLRLGTVSW